MHLLLKVLIFLGIGIVIAALVRRFAPETMANGFMDYDKAKEIAPTIFKGMDKEELEKIKEEQKEKEDKS